MRITVTAIIMWTFGALLSVALGVQPVAACTNNSQCPSHMTCQNSWIPWIKECKELRCNADSDCPSDRSSCEMGACRGPASSGSGGGGGGLSQGDVGGRCGQIKLGLVTKNVGCKPGLQCVKVPASSKSGTCQRPPA